MTPMRDDRKRAITRRQFQQAVLGAVTGVTSLTGACVPSQTACVRTGGSPSRTNVQTGPIPTATSKVTLGRAGFSVPRLAMGTGTAGWARGSAQTRLGKKAFVRLMHAGHERGASFIDAADLYGSHDYVREALKGMKRDELTLLSKLWFAEGAPKMQPTATARPEVERFLTELGVDMIDILLIHAVQDPKWPEQQARMRDELSELKSRGILRALGCSCHSHAALRAAAVDPWTDVILARINPGKRVMDEDAALNEIAQTLRLARRNGKAVIGMKIYGAGQYDRPHERQRSLRFALGGEVLDAMTIGHLNEVQLDDTIASMNRVLAESARNSEAR